MLPLLARGSLAQVDLARKLEHRGLSAAAATEACESLQAHAARLSASLTALALALELHLGAAPHAHAQGTRVSGRQASGRQAVVPRPTRSTAGDEPCVISSPCGNTISGRSSAAPAAPAAPKTRHSGHGTVIVEATTDTSVSPILTSNFNQGWYRDGILETPIPIHDPGDPSYIVGSLFIFGSDNEF